jgi:hypothetical protein
VTLICRQVRDDPDRPAQVPSQRACLLADRDGVHGGSLLVGGLFTGVVPPEFSLAPVRDQRQRSSDLIGCDRGRTVVGIAPSPRR